MTIVDFGFEVDQAQPLMPYGDDSNWLELAYAAWPTKLAGAGADTRERKSGDSNRVSTPTAADTRVCIG